MRRTARIAGWAAASAALILASGCDEAPAAARWNLVLITLDTTRADALSLLGGTEGATPSLDARRSPGG
jgi:hypothetical protein